jgi:hypothetical protein
MYRGGGEEDRKEEKKWKKRKERERVRAKGYKREREGLKRPKIKNKKMMWYICFFVFFGLIGVVLQWA